MPPVIQAVKQKPKCESSNKVNIKFETFIKFAKIVVAVSIPILYLQGLAFHQGQLGGLKIRSDFYPLSLEDALLEAYSFYLKSILIISSVALAWFILSIIVTLLEIKVLPKATKGKVFLSLEKAYDFIASIVSRRKSNFIGPGLLFFGVYSLVALGVVVALPYASGLSKGSKDFEKIKENYPDDTRLISINIGGNASVVSGKIVKTSKSFISFYNGHSIVTLPIGKVESIENPLDTKLNKKINADGK